MPVQQTFNSFRLFDVLADFIPGAVLLLAVLSLFQTGLVHTSFSTEFSLTALVVLAYITGHGIQWLMGQLSEAPSKFVDGMMVLEKDGKNTEIPFQVTEIEENFLELCRNEFDLSEDFDDYSALFELLLSYLDIMPSSKGLRFQALFSFLWAMETTSIIIFTLSIIEIGTGFLGLVFARSPLIGAVLAILSIFSFIIFRDRKDKFERNFVEYVILDVYNYSVVIENQD